MYKWGDGLDAYRKRIADGEARGDVIASLEERRKGLVDVMRDGPQPRVQEAIDQTDALIREIRNPTPNTSIAW